MNIKTSILFLILFLGIMQIRCLGQTAFNNLCFTPTQYRFLADAVIDRQVLKKDTVRLNSAVRELFKAHVADSLANTKQESVIALHGEKEAIFGQKINLLQDDLDGANKKVRRNRKIAIAGFGTIGLEIVIVGAYIFLKR